MAGVLVPMSDTTRETILVFGVIVLVVVGAIALMGGLIKTGEYVFARPACRALGEETNMPTKWRWQNGCYVQVGGQWVPEANWRVTGKR